MPFLHHLLEHHLQDAAALSVPHQLDRQIDAGQNVEHDLAAADLAGAHGDLGVEIQMCYPFDMVVRGASS